MVFSNAISGLQSVFAENFVLSPIRTGTSDGRMRVESSCMVTLTFVNDNKSFLLEKKRSH